MMICVVVNANDGVNLAALRQANSHPCKSLEKGSKVIVVINYRQ